MQSNPLAADVGPDVFSAAADAESRVQEGEEGLSLDVMRDPAQTSSVPEGQAVNVEAGLATVGGNRELYRELLLRFVDHYGESARELRGLLACGDLRGAAVWRIR